MHRERILDSLSEIEPQNVLVDRDDILLLARDCEDKRVTQDLMNIYDAFPNRIKLWVPTSLVLRGLAYGEMPK